jgi:hypothetical protein
MTRTLKTLTAAAFLAAVPALATTPASAAIVCDGAYQIIDGHPHSTPFCQDRYLAKVARSYGYKVTERQVRHCYSTKSDICRAIGSDNRIYDICYGYRDMPDFGGGNRR